ncbi:MAG: 5'-deoxynucleotidase [Candidatus Limivicinus sp.]
MSYNFFAYISRMRYIGRWSLMRNAIPENIQEHSHMAAVIAHALALIRRDVFGVDCDCGECAAVALFHDSSEILTGDLPTPIKYHSRDIQGAYKAVENLACEKLLDTLPPELRPSYEPLLTGETQARVHDIVKAADKLSAYIKCIEERRAGNDEFISAEKQIRRTLEANPMPEVKYFMEHFIPAFELNLDELGTLEEEKNDGTDKA